MTPNNNLNLIQSPYLNEIWRKIKQLQELQPGWDFGEGEAISDDVAKRALIIAEYGIAFKLNANVKPSSDGELIVGLFKDDRFLFLTVKPNNLFDLIYEKGIGVNYEILDSKENLNLSSLFNYITEWALSELYTLKNMTVMHTALQAMPSKYEMEQYQFLKNNVLILPIVIPYADTSSNITKQQSATPLAFAGLNKANFKITQTLQTSKLKTPKVQAEMNAM